MRKKQKNKVPEVREENTRISVYLLHFGGFSSNFIMYVTYS